MYIDDFYNIRMFVGLLFFFNLQFITFTQSVMECNPTDSLFTETKDGTVVDGGQWKDVSKFDGAQRCISKCHVAQQCKSVTVNETACILRDVDRMSAGIRIITQPNSRYYEKHNCSTFKLNQKFIAVGSNAIDCKDIYTKGWKTSGIYYVNFGNGTYQAIRCEMSLLGGGWTVVQNRVDGSVDFNRNWKSYKEGFGEINGNFWIGNDHLHKLTKDQSNEVLVFLEIETNAEYYPMYDEFRVAGEEDEYRLTIGNYVPVLGTNLPNVSSFRGFERHDGKMFSTPDKDNDRHSSKDCAKDYSSGWWFDNCYSVSLNGIYGENSFSGISWDQLTWNGGSTITFVSKVKIMIRKKNN